MLDLARATAVSLVLASLVLACATGSENSSSTTESEPSSMGDSEDPGSLAEGLPFDVDGDLPLDSDVGEHPLVGMWVELWGDPPATRLHVIDREIWRRRANEHSAENDELALRLAHVDAPAGWMIVRYAANSGVWPDRWARVHWYVEGDGVWVCQSPWPRETAFDAAVDPFTIRVGDPRQGCAGFAWTWLQRVSPGI